VRETYLASRWSKSVIDNSLEAWYRYTVSMSCQNSMFTNLIQDQCRIKVGAVDAAALGPFKK